MINTPKIVITDIEGETISIELEEAKKIDAEVVRGNCNPESPEDEVINLVQDADAVLVGYANITSRVIKALKHCKVIVCYSVGYNNIDVKAATEAGIYVVNLPTYCMEEVSTHIVAMILTLVRKLFLYDKDMRSGHWDYLRQAPVFALNESNLGVVGFGNIARLVVKKMLAFGVKPLAYDPFINEEVFWEYGAQRVEFEELVKRSDIISLNVPLTPDTRNLFGEEQFKKMKNTAFIVNTARGGIIDEHALYKALKEGWIAGAALDVMNPEPPESDNPLFELDNIIFSPHAAFYSETSLHKLHLFAIQEAVRALQGEVPKNVVNKEVLQNKGYVEA
jgi:D-3-phosphoglycerate dehydrogenase